MALTDKQKEEMVAEAMDSQRVKFFCPEHFYSGPVKGKPEFKPGLDCANCWKIFYFYEFATTPPDERRQKLDEIDEVLHKMTEMVTAGKWDFEPYSHAQVEIGTE